jgi:hypothetical protein
VEYRDCVVPNFAFADHRQVCLRPGGQLRQRCCGLSIFGFTQCEQIIGEFDAAGRVENLTHRLRRKGIGRVKGLRQMGERVIIADDHGDAAILGL